jgi:CRISPR-associated protein (TIGR03984 family)
MNTAEAPLALAGCDLTPLDSVTCERYVSWLLGEGDAAATGVSPGLVWALAHCDDGVTWGTYDAGAKTWHLGNRVAPEVSPPIRSKTLQELRLFGEGGEVLIWRTDEGLQGRFLREAEPPIDRSDEANPLRPLDEPRILRGTLVLAECEHGFTHVGDGAGAEQVLPLAVNKEQLRAAQVRLDVRHYYEVDEVIGAVRIAATRLVRLTVGGAHGG